MRHRSRLSNPEICSSPALRIAFYRQKTCCVTMVTSHCEHSSTTKTLLLGNALPFAAHPEAKYNTKSLCLGVRGPAQTQTLVLEV